MSTEPNRFFSLLIAWLIFMAVPIGVFAFGDPPLLWLVTSASLFVVAIFWRSFLLAGLLVVVLSVVNAMYFLSYYLQDAGFNDNFFYHVRLDSLTADTFSIYFLPVLIWFVSLIVILVLLKRRVSLENFISNKAYTLVSLPVLLFSLVFYTPLQDIFHYQLKDGVVLADKEVSPQDRKVLQDIHQAPKLVRVSSNTQKTMNLVLLYLESVEQSYFDDEYWPNLLPRLNAIRDQSVTFNHVDQVPEAGWTIAGMVASQCGLPLSSPYGAWHNTTAVSDEFMSEAVCMSDLLKQVGYSNEYFGGAKISFGGKEAFHKSHQYDRIQGYDELKEKVSDKKYRHGWGWYDDTVLKFAQDRFDELSAQNSPFMLSVLTLDTHHPTGHASSSCRPYQTNSNHIPMLDALHCTDQLAANFIQHIRRSDVSDDTVIVILSDHLSMRNGVWEKLKHYPKKRKMSFFINFPDGKTDVIESKGTHYDIGATVLDALNIEYEGQLGLGTSLLKGDGYLDAVAGHHKIGKSRAVREFVHTLWRKDYGNIGRGIKIFDKGKEVNISGKHFSFHSDGWSDAASVLLKIDPDSADILDIKIWPYHAKLKDADLSRMIVNDPEYVYFSISKKRFLSGLMNDHYQDDDLVYFLGSAGVFPAYRGSLSTSPISIDDTQIVTLLEAAEAPDAELLDFRRWRVSPEDVETHLAVRHADRFLSKTPEFRVLSCAYKACKSQFNINGEKFAVERGINIFGIDADGHARLLRRFDGCSAESVYDEKGGLSKFLSSKTDWLKFVVLVDDSAGCGNNLRNVADWALASGLPQLRHVWYRQAYAALYDLPTGSVLEFTQKEAGKVSVSWDGQGIQHEVD